LRAEKFSTDEKNKGEAKDLSECDKYLHKFQTQGPKNQTANGKNQVVYRVIDVISCKIMYLPGIQYATDEAGVIE
jgi:hypothetical protein